MPRAYRTEDIAMRRMAYKATSLRMRLAAKRFLQHWVKANFNPGQPRVPRGNPNGGQWTRIGGAERPRVIRIGDNPLDPDPDSPAENLDEIDVPSFLPIPETRPGSLGERYEIIRNLATSVFYRTRFRPGRSVSQILSSIQAPKWLREYYPYVEAYRAPPRTLLQLQADARTPKAGYDRHHIVEKTPALRDGYARSVVDGPNNVVLVSRFKHWEITAWYSTKNVRYNGLTPREYLSSKSWTERQELGLYALRLFGVLK